MSRYKTCEVCGKMTFKTLDEFAEIGWAAFQIGGGNYRCFCPNHQAECKAAMRNALEKGEV